jgi:putative phosphoribosyl transferase
MRDLWPTVSLGEHTLFADRADAGRKLAARLGKYKKQTDVMVLGAPRGGVPVAFEVSRVLHAPLDVFVVRKLGVPGREELAFGALASGGVRYLDEDVVMAAGLSDQEVAGVTAREEQVLQRREQVYRTGHALLDVRGRTVILVDDGVATGASLFAGIGALRQLGPKQIVVAVPVAPPEACRQLAAEADAVVCLCSPEAFYAVGQFYRDFSEVSDDEVRDLLRSAQGFTSFQAN